MQKATRRETGRFSAADRSSILGLVNRNLAGRTADRVGDDEFLDYLERITRGRVEQAMRWLDSRRRSRAEVRRIDREVLAATERAS